MAYETGSATGISDLMSKLFTFATGLTTTPWTQDELDTLQGTLHLGDCYVTFRWDDTVEEQLGIYQSLGWTSSTEAHLMPDDSGNGDTSVPIDSGRRVNFTTPGPFTAYHFFASEGDTPCIYVVVEYASGLFRHFGFGNIKKFGTWTGGEFTYGHYWHPSGADDPDYTLHQFLLDGISGNTTDCATMHMEGFSWQGASEKWGAFSARTRPGGTDRAGEDRSCLVGGARHGFWGWYLCGIRYSAGAAFKPIIPIAICDFNQGPTPDEFVWLGEMADIGIVNMHAFTPGQDITVGTDTWTVFPWVRKRYEKDDQEESWNAGVAYKKVT